MEVSVVNMMPEPFSGEANDDFEPNVAVNPANPLLIAASAMTLDSDPQSTHRPIYVSNDGGASWSLPSIVPASGPPPTTTDITLRFPSSGTRLYVAFLTAETDALAVARTADLTFASEMELISELPDGDQPYVEAATVPTGADAGKDRVYVGFNNEETASMHYSLDAAAPAPAFTTVQLESRGGLGGAVYYNLPQIRPAVHPDGHVYAVFYSVTTPSTSPTVDVVVVRDDDWGVGPEPFTDLKDTDQNAGKRLVQNRIVGGTSFGQELGGGELSIAIDPNNSAIVYVCWADTQPATGYTLHVRRSSQWGESWDEDDLRTIPNALNPAFAVNREGVVGFLFQQYVQAAKSGPRWETHFQFSADGSNWSDLLLSSVPAEPTLADRLGDYIHLVAVESDFYGVFSAENTPNPKYFPSTPNLDTLANGISYQRKHDFSSKKLFAPDGTEVPRSVDPFFFKVAGIGQLAWPDIIVTEAMINPLAYLSPQLFIKLNLPDPGPIERFLPQLRTELARMTPQQRQQLLRHVQTIRNYATAFEKEIRAAELE
jgi:hypothetical protein